MELGEELTDEILADPASAAISDKLRAALAFIEVLTLRPDELSASHVDAAKKAGLSEAAIRDAGWAAVCFNVIDRVADTLGFDIPAKRDFEIGAQALLKRGYTM